MFLKTAKYILKESIKLEDINDNFSEIENKLNIDWSKVKFTKESLIKGILVEREHGSMISSEANVTGDDLIKTSRIALAHLLEDPNYYEKLEQMENP
jgi:hypothetical protein